MKSIAHRLLPLAFAILYLSPHASATSVRFPVAEMTGSSADVVINVRALNNPVIYNGSFYYMPKNGTNLTTSGGTVTNSFIPGIYTMAVVGIPRAWTIYVTNSSDVLSAVDLSREIVRYSGIQTITGTAIQITNDGYGNFWLVDTNGGGGNSGALTNNHSLDVALTKTLTLGSIATDGSITLTDGDTKTYTATVGSDGWVFGDAVEATTFIGDGSLLTGVGNVTSSGLAAGSYAINGMLVDGDAGLYLTAVGKTNSQFAARADGGFKALKEYNLWTNLIDGAILGTNLNLSGSYWRTLKLNYGTNVNSPTVLDYGLQFDGTSRAYVRNLSDMRTNTILVCFQSIGNFDTTSTNAIFAAQNASSSNGSVAVFAYPYVGSPTYAAHPLHHFVGQNISGGEVVSNSFTAYTATSVSARHMDEFYVSIGVSNLSRTATINGYGATQTNAAFALTSAITSFNIGAFLAGDSGAGSSGMFKGTVKAFLIFNQMLTTNEVRQAMKALRWFDVRESNYIFVGDSLTQAYDDGYDTASFSTNNWPWLFMNTPANSNRYFYRNWAAGGRSVTTFGTDDYTNKVQVFSPGGAVKKSVLMYRLGANDILQYASVNNSFQAARNFWNVANRDGFTIEVMNVTPLTNAFGYSNDINRVEFNRGLETNAQYFSKLWPVSDLFPYINTNTMYSIDGVHPMYAANRAIADWLTSGGSSITTTGALKRFSGTIKADAFWGDGTRLDFGEDVAFVRDDFFSGVGTTPIGDIGWSSTGVSALRNTVYDTSRWGVLSLESSGTSGTAGMIYLSASGSGYLGSLPLATVVPWRAKFIMRPTNTNSVGHAVGFTVPSSVWGATTHGIYARMDTSLGDSTWLFITRGAGGATTNNTSVLARTNNFVKFEFKSDVVGQIAMRVDEGTWFTNTTTLPASVSPFMAIVPRENVQKTNAIDFFEFVARPDR